MFYRLQVAVVVFLVCVLASSLLAAPGSLDPTFGTNGIYNDNQSAFSLIPWDIQQQPDGALLVVGCSIDASKSYKTNRVLLRRYNRNGPVDMSFGYDGFAVGSLFPPGPFDVYGEGRSVTVQPDYKIVVAGLTYVNSSSDTRFTIWRFLPNGSLDTTFGTEGQMILYQGSVGVGHSVTMDQGKILVAGSVTTASGVYNVMRRINLDGSFDTTFGQSSVVVAGQASGGSGTGLKEIGLARALSVRSTNGDIFLGGSDFGAHHAIAKYTSTGAVATSFGNNGMAILPFDGLPCYGTYGSGFTTIMAYPDGRVAGSGPSFNLTQNLLVTSVVARFDASGIPDQLFNQNGLVAEPCVVNPVVQLFSSTLQTDGKIDYLSIGATTQSQVLYRVNADGTPDTTFAPANVDFGVPQYLLFQPEMSRLVRLGTYSVTTGRVKQTRIKLARYLP
ncbi:MAG: hypothetical protein ABI878_02895 [Acidobacteriota bacterium]